jgi:hypothetical protein
MGDRAIWVQIAYGWLEMAIEIERDGETDPIPPAPVVRR